VWVITVPYICNNSGLSDTVSSRLIYEILFLYPLLVCLRFVQFYESRFQFMFVTVSLQVLLVETMKMTVFWKVAPCGLVEIGQHFISAYCLWSISLFLQDYMTQAPRKQRSSCLLHAVLFEKSFNLNILFVCYSSYCY
jgi:hypothetical protein